jgi:hypothetical protein
MLSYYERELIRGLRRADGARCFRCNTPLPAKLAPTSEGLCTACAEGQTIQFTPYRGPTRPAVPSGRAAWTARFARLDESLFRGKLFAEKGEGGRPWKRSSVVSTGRRGRA